MPSVSRPAALGLVLAAALPAFSVSGCAAIGVRPGGTRAGSSIPIARDRFVAPAGVLRVAWRRQLVKSEGPSFSYKPQEFGAAVSSPDGEQVYVGASNKQLYALDAKSGEVAWHVQLAGAMSSEPLYVPAGAATHEPMLLLGDDGGILTALDPRTGTVKWTYQARGPIQVRPTVHEGMVYFTSNEGRVYALDVQTGAWRWQYDREIPEAFAIRGHSGVLPLGGRVYVGFPDGYLATLASQTGEVIWTRQLSGDATRFTDVDSTPVLVRDTLYVSCYATGVYALDVKDGSTRWRFDLEAAGPLTVDTTQPGGERVYATSAHLGLFCLDGKGRKLWQQAMTGLGELSQPTLYGSHLLVSAAASGMYLLDKQSGELQQFFDPGQGTSARPVPAGDHVYLLSNAGAFFALTRG